MDSILARTFRIHSNPKWVFERWKIFEKDDGRSAVSGIAAETSRYWRALRDCLAGNSGALPAQELFTLYHNSKVMFGTEVVEDLDPLRWRQPTRFFPFLDDASMAVAGDGRCTLVEIKDEKDLAGFSLGEALKISPGHARSILSLMRASLIDVPLDQTCFLLPAHAGPANEAVCVA
jgi:hypothetical protein